MSKLEVKFQRLAESYCSRGHKAHLGYIRYEKLSKYGVPVIVSTPYLQVTDKETKHQYLVNHNGTVVTSPKVA